MKGATVAPRFTRKNAAALRWIRAAFIAACFAAAVPAFRFYPDWLTAAIALAAFAIAMWTPAVAVLLGIAAFSLPVAAADFVAGTVLCVAGFAAAQALSSRDAAGAVAVLLTVACLPLGVGFAGPVLAGYLFGLRDGAAGAGIGAASAIAAGAVLGTARIGVLLAGGRASNALISLGKAPESPLSFAWLSESVSRADPARFLDALTAAGPTWALAAQVALWAAVAAVAAWLRGSDRPARERLQAVFGLALLTVLAAGGSAAIWRLSGQAVPLAELLKQAGASVLVASAVGAASEWVFPRVAVESPSRATAPASLRAEEADVDELLRLIASAEEELASRHTKTAIVMLTDLKAFSQMTERLGSVECAKVVQRHRDVLLPIIERHGGKGKPTGGDGLVAAFSSADEAVAAAVEMQEAIERLGSEAALPEGLAVRIGIASGEVVVDAGGRPFLGAALNLAARVMGLADGGRIFVSGDVARAARSVRGQFHSHGEFELKNIARPVEVVEVLWKGGLAPQPIALGGENQASGPSSGPDA